MATYFRVCIGETNEEERYVKIDPNDIDEANPVLMRDLMDMLNGKHMEV